MSKSSKTKKHTAYRTWHYFWQATKQNRLYTYGTFISTPIVVLARDVITPLLLSEILGMLADNPEKNYIISNILPLALLALGLRIIFSSVLGELRIYWHWKMEIFAMYQLANLAFDTVSAQSMQFHSDRFSGSLVSQTNKFVNAYERLFDSIVWSVIPLAITIVFQLIIMFIRVPLFAVGMLIFIIIYAIISYVAFRKIARFNVAHAEAENKQTGQLADSISNIISVKSYAKEAHEHRRFANFSRATANTYMDLLHATMVRNVCFDFVYIGSTIILLTFLMGGQRWFGLSVSSIILIVNYTLNLTGRLWDLNGIFKDFNRVFGDSEAMTEILDMKDDVVDELGAKNIKLKNCSINFNNISFTHREAKRPIFENFSLDIKPGERVGLVGISGSGKTTLTKLLLRFADVDAGSIMIDDQNIKNVTQKSLRENIAYVPQETALFHRSIAENISYARPDASLAEIKKAARLANAEEFIKDLPDGYDTLVGERGVKLSGGQRQRVAIARAILKDAPILVLDEATSALDSESEALIQGALNNLMKNRTSIVIAHRLSTVANLDRIVVLDNGKIVEQGTHSELLKKDGAYKKLWSRQSGAFLKEE